MIPPTGVKRLREIAEAFSEEFPEAPADLREAVAQELVMHILTEWPTSHTKEENAELQRFTTAILAIRKGKAAKKQEVAHVS